MRLTAPVFAADVLARHGARTEGLGGRAIVPMAVLAPRPPITVVHRHAVSHTAQVHVDKSVHLRVASTRVEPVHHHLVERVVARTRRVDGPGRVSSAPRPAPVLAAGVSPAPAPSSFTPQPQPQTPAWPPVPAPSPPAVAPVPAPVSVVRSARPPSPGPPRESEAPVAITQAEPRLVADTPFPPRPAAAAPPTPLPQHEVDRLADRVMDVIERRVGAYRERRGRS